ncbi:MAG: hypothetical protein HZB70_02350 [Candidatus Berkelbacteria bacterium]|nr:MAG: hypothetical protein HZB70_02350 [Candidatus Berkelbacteria bacterium]QQG51847.1 MAG: hypothetical protein HY845_00645 [Candidatus Berkelbacteria bacterium]
MSVHRLVLLIHLFGAAVVLGIVFFSLALALGKPLDETRLKAIQIIRRFGVYAMGVTVLAGLYLAFEDWAELKGDKLFWAKLVLIALDYFVAVRLINAKVEAALTGNGNATKGLTSLAWASLIAFIAIFTIGRIYL